MSVATVLFFSASWSALTFCNPVWLHQLSLFRVKCWINSLFQSMWCMILAWCHPVSCCYHLENKSGILTTYIREGEIGSRRKVERTHRFPSVLRTWSVVSPFFSNFSDKRIFVWASEPSSDRKARWKGTVARRSSGFPPRWLSASADESA